jgi:hypothetical protein
MIIYFTFGQTHLHPYTDEPMKDYWVEIDCKDIDEAREKMVSKYGRKWGLMYTEETMEKHWYPKGCYERI